MVHCCAPATVSFPDRGVGSGNETVIQRELAAMAVTCSKRVLSIQSHVVHGYVGNNAATFPLQVSWTDTHTVLQGEV